MVRSFHTFVVYEYEEGERVLRYIKPQHVSEPRQITAIAYERYALTPYSQLAGWVDPEDTGLIVRLYQKLVDRYGEENIDFLEVKIDVQHEVVPMDAGELLAERRRIAINKLRPDEYKVLGIEQLGVYHKLKYHEDE